MPKNNRHGKASIISQKQYLQIRKFLNPRQQLLFDIAWYTGERWGAIVQLKVRDVYNSFGAPLDSITFRAASRKNKLTRQVPVHPALKHLLTNYQAPSEIWLFPSNINAEKHITREGAAWFLTKAIAQAKLNHQGICTHSTRRSFITHLHEAGVDIRIIQQITGHQDLKALQGYIDVSPDRVANAIALL